MYPFFWYSCHSRAIPFELKMIECLLGNVPYVDRSPDEDWTSPTVLLLYLWEGFERNLVFELTILPAKGGMS